MLHKIIWSCPTCAVLSLRAIPTAGTQQTVMPNVWYNMTQSRDLVCRCCYIVTRARARLWWPICGWRPLRAVGSHCDRLQAPFPDIHGHADQEGGLIQGRHLSCGVQPPVGPLGLVSSRPQLGVAKALWTACSPSLVAAATMRGRGPRAVQPHLQACWG